jgi:uncharacterized protein YkwD
VPLPPVARVLLVTLALAGALAVLRPAPAQAARVTKAEARLLNVINNSRANHGMRRLQVGRRLQPAAHDWAIYLRRHNAFYHGRLRIGTSENVGWVSCRSGWAGTLVRMWLRSSSHRPHLLDRSARAIGVGVSTGSWSGYGCVRMAVTRFR